MHLHLIGYLIGATVTTVEVEIHELGGRTELHPHEPSEVIGQGIANHGLVAMVGQQRPALCIRKALTQQTLFLLELHTVRLLLAVPP